MEKEKLDRIGELSRKARAEGLTPKEADEQFALRNEYLAEMRGNFQNVLDNTYLQRPDGTKEKLKKKSNGLIS